MVKCKYLAVASKIYRTISRVPNHMENVEVMEFHNVVFQALESHRISEVLESFE